MISITLVCSLHLLEALAALGKCSEVPSKISHWALQVLELCIGHRPSQPLPAPHAAAVALREKCLELVEEWRDKWGHFYPQVYPYMQWHSSVLPHLQGLRS